MQIVIDIPDETMEHILDATETFVEVYDIIRRIANGTPLPKGHGDLIDRDKLVPDCDEQEIHDGEDWRNEYCGVSCMQIEVYAEAIVKADEGAE